MHHHIKLLLLSLVLLVTGPVACGMRGDLYLPQEPAQAERAGGEAPADAEPAKTDTE